VQFNLSEQCRSTWVNSAGQRGVFRGSGQVPLLRQMSGMMTKCISSTSLALLISLAPAVEAQTLPNPVQTGATAGIVRKSDEAVGRVIGRAADSVDRDRTASTDLFAGLREGSQVVVQNHDLDMTQGRVTHIDRKKQELVIALEDGSKQKLHLTERAAAQADGMTGESARVAVSYTNDAGERIVHYLRQIR
jgi:hypothetical protein